MGNEDEGLMSVRRGQEDFKALVRKNPHECLLCVSSSDFYPPFPLKGTQLE